MSNKGKWVNNVVEIFNILLYFEITNNILFIAELVYHVVVIVILLLHCFKQVYMFIN